MQAVRGDVPLYLIIALYLILATAWNLVTPPFESPDEDAHVAYVLLVADEARLPDPRTADGARVGNEFFQPPLYYAMLAAALRLSGMTHDEPLPARVPGWAWDARTVPANYFVPTPDQYAYLHLLRELSALFGVVTVLCTYLAATLLGATGRVRIAATMATAALPQFTFISATVNPDALAAALASIGLVLLLGIVRSTEARPRAVAAFGAVVAAGVLTEYHAGYLLALALLGYLFVLGRSRRRTIGDAAIALAVFLCCTGWWFAWNVARYGEPSGLVQYGAEYRRTLLDPFFVDYFPRLFYDSFLGAYGWLNLFLPDVWYLLFGLLWLGALWGICRGTIVTHRWPAERRLLVLAPMLVLAVVLYRNLSFNAAQGRYLFVALPAISCLFTFGLAELPHRIGRWALIAAPAFLLAANLFSLLFVWSAFARA